MFKKLFAFTIICAAALPAEATPTMRGLAEAIKATGTEIATNVPSVCSDPEVKGMYQYKKNVLDRLTICVDNHNGNNAELYDTILHESIHLAQACNKGKALYSFSSITKAAQPNELDFVAMRYPANQVHTELEARVIAREQDEVYVTNLIKKFCK